MTKQIRFVSQPAIIDGQDVADVAAFDDAGNPVLPGAGGTPTAKIPHMDKLAADADSTATAAAFNRLLDGLVSSGYMAPSGTPVAKVIRSVAVKRASA